MSPESVNGGGATPTGSAGNLSPTDVAPPPPLSETQLENVLLLAREGNREITIRKVLGLTARQWRALKAVDDSPVMEALEAGRADGAALVITFMKTRMEKNNSMEAAKWLAEHVYGITNPAAGEGVGRTTHVLVLPAPMSDAEWERIQRGAVIDVTPTERITHVER